MRRWRIFSRSAHPMDEPKIEYVEIHFPAIEIEIFPGYPTSTNFSFPCKSYSLFPSHPDFPIAPRILLFSFLFFFFFWSALLYTHHSIYPDHDKSSIFYYFLSLSLFSFVLKAPGPFCHVNTVCIQHSNEYTDEFSRFLRGFFIFYIFTSNWVTEKNR